MKQTEFKIYGHIIAKRRYRSKERRCKLDFTRGKPQLSWKDNIYSKRKNKEINSLISERSNNFYGRLCI